MEKETVLKTGKYLSIFVMILTGISVAIAASTGYLNTQDYGQVVIAFGVFLVALRAYMKDKYGVF
jgi:ABC-type uncharacterized transport system permease subunit